jgi:radical SAM protein with 4Fe4S-binding SPASM domain
MTYKPLAPDYVQFSPTLRCDRHCDFCFNKALPGKEDMPIASFRRMIDRITGAGVQVLDIIGGEPTLHRELLPMIEHACGRGMRVNISSNGRDPDQLAEIMRRFTRATVGVSVNDHETLQDLERFIRKHHPIVKTVFSRVVDHGLIEQILALAPRRYYLLYRDAFGPGELDESIPFDRFLEEAGIRYGSQAGMVFCSGFIPDLDQYPQLRMSRCPGGTTKLGIHPDGSVFPCNLLFERTEYLLGNILADPFDAIWRHPALTFFRTFTGNACPRTSCELHNKCHGGCPAHSYALTGKLSAPEPRCVPGS